MLARLTETVRAEDPGQILVTGDLVHSGLPEAIEAAASWLEMLGPPDRVMLVPGNHDIYAADSWGAVDACWAPYLAPSQRPGEPLAHASFPHVRRLHTAQGPLCLIGLSSAVASPPFMAYGRLGRAQLERLEAELAAADGLRCVLLHHPPLPGMTTWRKGLQDAAALAGVLARQDAELVLHGHVHRNVERQGPGGARVFGTASASSVDPSCAYRVFDVVREGDRWQVNMRLVSLNGSGRASSVSTVWEVPVRLPAASVPAAG